MPKHSTKKQKQSGASAVTSSASDLSTFDESALTALTATIEKGFSAPKPKHQDGKKNQKHQRASEVKPEVKNVVGNTSDFMNGKKRDASGNVKKTNVFSNSDQSNGKVSREVLLQEILNLGGTEEDLELIEDIDSEDEYDSYPDAPSAEETKFARELSQFVTGLGINGQAEATAEEPEDVEDSEEESWEEDSGDKTPAVAVPAPVQNDDKNSQKASKDVNRLMFEARPDWHAAGLSSLPVPSHSEMDSHRETIAELQKYALKLLEADSSLYSSKHMSSTSSHRFLATIMSSGTLADKVSALTLVVQESPVHTTKSFESLLALAKKRSRGQAVSALGALKDLLGAGVVLPADRRLRSFSTQPGLLGTLQNDFSQTWRSSDPLPGAITKGHLISWAYEDWLKESYFDMLKVLEGWCNDEIDFARQRAVTYVYELLRDKPEQESNLLRLLVNKLGDPDKKIASRTSYLILQLQTTHPLMKPIIVKAIETELLLRPNQSSHARYYAINTLNQTILSTKEEEVAQKLLSIYFGLFVNLLKKPDLEKLQAGPAINKKGQLQGGGGAKGKKAQDKADKETLAKLANEETTEKMISAVLTGVNRAFPFAGSDDSSLEKHMDTLFKITHSSNFNTSIQALMLIQQLANTRNVAIERFFRTLYESLLDPRLITSSKHALYLNLLFRSLKADLNIKRVKAFVKRLLQIITLHQPPFVCGVIYLLRELEITFPGLKSLLNDAEERDDMDEEVFMDVVDDEEEIVAVTVADTMHPDRIKLQPQKGLYDGRKRDPEHSNADKSCLWELLPFLTHFHPSVSLFASRLLDGSEMPAKPDLVSHTLIHFLDRFVYRNAKSSVGSLRGSSIMQPLAGGDSSAVLVSNRTANKNDSVNSESFWRKKAEDVAVDEVFFHKYFSQIGKNKVSSKKGKKDRQVKSKAGSVDEDEEEDEIWQALVESRPDVEGPSDDEEDLEMLDVEDSDDEDRDGGVEAEEDQRDGEAVSDDNIEINSDEFGGDIGEESDGVEAVFSEDEDDLMSESEMFANELERAQKVNDATEKETSRSKKKKMKALPTFASMEDYATLLDQDADEEL